MVFPATTFPRLPQNLPTLSCSVQWPFQPDLSSHPLFLPSPPACRLPALAHSNSPSLLVGSATAAWPLQNLSSRLPAASYWPFLSEASRQAFSYASEPPAWPLKTSYFPSLDLSQCFLTFPSLSPATVPWLFHPAAAASGLSRPFQPVAASSGGFQPAALSYGSPPTPPCSVQ